MGCCEHKAAVQLQVKGEPTTAKGRAAFLSRIPLRSTIQCFSEQTGVYCVRVDSVAGRIYGAGEETWIGVFDLKTSTELHKMHGHKEKVYCIAVDHDRLVSGSQDTTVKVWDTNTFACVHTLTGHAQQVLCVLYNGQDCFSGSMDKTVIQWDVDKGRALRIFQQHSAPVFAIQLLAPHTLITGSMDTTLKWWDLSKNHWDMSTADPPADPAAATPSPRPRATDGVRTTFAHNDAVMCMELGGGRTEGGHLVTGGGRTDKLVKVWDLQSLKCVGVLLGHTASIRSITHVGSTKVVTASKDGTIREWDLKTCAQTRVLVENDPGFFCVQYEDGVLVTGSHDGSIKVYDMLAENDQPHATV